MLNKQPHYLNSLNIATRFDRMLIAQALVENLTLISRDSKFDQYGVRRVW